MAIGTGVATATGIGTGVVTAMAGASATMANPQDGAKAGRADGAIAMSRLDRREKARVAGRTLTMETARAVPVITVPGATSAIGGVAIGTETGIAGDRLTGALKD